LAINCSSKCIKQKNAFSRLQLPKTPGHYFDL
jgi:hypothetical protein